VSLSMTRSTAASVWPTNMCPGRLAKKAFRTGVRDVDGVEPANGASELSPFAKGRTSGAS
jgi:hypothetical protein